MGERIGFGLYKLCRNRGSMGRMSVFWLWWCGWCLGTGSERVGCCYVCMRCESRLFVEMEGPGICVLCSADTCTS